MYLCSILYPSHSRVINILTTQVLVYCIIVIIIILYIPTHKCGRVYNSIYSPKLGSPLFFASPKVPNLLLLPRREWGDSISGALDCLRGDRVVVSGGRGDLSLVVYNNMRYIYSLIWYYIPTRASLLLTHRQRRRRLLLGVVTPVRVNR